MPCEKYASWLTDAALGELGPKREVELLAHATECSACRDALNHARAVRAAVDRGVESLVAGTPSPEFESRLRARLAAEPAPSRIRQLWPAWAPAAAALATAAVVLIAFIFHSPHQPGPNATPPVAILAQPDPAPAIASNPPVETKETLPSRHVHSSRVPPSARAHSAEPEVLVEPGQFAAISAYADALTAGSIDGMKLLAAQQQLETPLEITPLEFVPLEKPASDTAASAGADSSRP